jgi:hypothetical protein
LADTHSGPKLTVGAPGSQALEWRFLYRMLRLATYFEGVDLMAGAAQKKTSMPSSAEALPGAAPP